MGMGKDKDFLNGLLIFRMFKKNAQVFL